MNELLDGAGYKLGDVAIACMITLSALLTYARVAFEEGSHRHPISRLTMGLGFTIWALRFWYAAATGGDVMVAPMSMLAIAMVTGGYCTVQLLAIQRAILIARHPIYCLQKSGAHCLREDRVIEILKDHK